MRKDSRSHTNPDLLEACRRLAETAETAETFVNHARRQKRIEAERSALPAALSHAQLVLSVARLPQEADKGSSKREKQQRDTRALEDQLKQSTAGLVKSQQTLEQLDWLIQPVTTALDELLDKTKRAQTNLEDGLEVSSPCASLQGSR